MTNRFNRSLLKKLAIGSTLLGLALVTNPALAQATTFDWNSLGLADEAALASGSVVTSADGNVDMTVTWSTVTDGGSFVFSTFTGDDWVSYEAGVVGAESSVLQAGFNNGNDDPDDKVIITFSFNRPVQGLNFDLLDIDGDDAVFDDGVEVYADGVNIRTVDSGGGTGSDYSDYVGSAAMVDNETYMDGWESDGNINVADSSSNGNVGISFGATPVSVVRIEYFTTDDSPGNPSQQAMGIGNLSISGTQYFAQLDSDNDGILNEVENPDATTTTTVNLSGSFPAHFDNNTFSELWDGDTSYSTSDNKRIHQDGDLNISLTTTVPSGTTFDVYWDNQQSGSDGIIVSFSNDGGASFFQVETNEPASNEPVTRTWSVVSTGAFNFVRLVSIQDGSGDDPRIHELGINGGIGSQTLTVAIQGTTDTDGDGITDDLDLDSDNDGISDLYESGTSNANILADINNDGTISSTEAADLDFDGLADIFDQNTADITAGASVGTTPLNSDSDAIDNFRDLDSDNDGIPDTVEARATELYTQNDGDVSNDDADNDGVIALFDANDLGAQLFGGTFIAPVNTDGEEEPDFLDINSDDDPVDDVIESGLTLGGSDSNTDGIDDSVNASYSDPDGAVNFPASYLANEFGDTTEIAFREIGSIAVSIVKTATPTQAISGQTISFTLTACETANTGDATNVVATDVLNAIYGVPTNPGGDVNFSYSSPTLTCDFGVVTGGSCKTCTFDVIAP